jgi:predicted nucleotidyltransferase component of viral defense system
MNIKIELNKRVRKNNTYKNIKIENIGLLCMDKKSLFTNKLVALSERLYARDLYDVYFFFKNKFEIKEDLIKERT